ncbi:HET-domain-containing protein [Coniochaeta ligniaria NRRL 30616]|uniref:HET-domain-containing protein n=1 Tax=Coniochaeta ligniaria NRRL 30616 TaxID=1408157 RepID=A0A1J7IKM2_9PEZI|nr:HET-domain-containing protein [Coniochaeta ligniaria NRRL 30616]
MSDGIPLQSLPPVFQDFIQTAKGLYVRYVWIDALCIIQDSETDWQREAAKMAEIYGNSFLTVAAAGSASPYDGIFAPRHASFNVAGVQCDVVHHFPNGPIAPAFPLLKRAWCYQERILAPRVLYYGPTEISWECRRSQACQCGSPFREYTRISLRALFEFCQTATTADAKARDRFWQKIIMQYSLLSFTKESDRLPALAGLIDYVKTISQDFLAGLRRDALVTDMLWYRRYPATTRERNQAGAAVWRAPSWSWAAIPGPVTYENLEYPKVLDAKCVHEGHSKTGRLVSGKVKLRCQTLTGKLIKAGSLDGPSEGWEHRPWDRPGSKLEIYIQNRAAEVYLDCCEDALLGLEVFVVRMATLAGRDQLLVLKKSEEAGESYIRIGYVDRSVTRRGPVVWDRLKKSWVWAKETRDITII